MGFLGKCRPAKTTASGRVTRRASSDPACFSHSGQGLARLSHDIGSAWNSSSTEKPLPVPGRNLDRSNSTPPTGATSRRRPPRGAFPIPRPLAVVDYYGCMRRKNEGSTCCGLEAGAVDDLVAQQVLRALEPATLECEPESDPGRAQGARPPAPPLEAPPGAGHL